MSIAGKHSYRFRYLKSEEWKTVRIEALTRDKCKCALCDEESQSNDVHHMWYPENIYQTTKHHLVTLCRHCHDFVHAMVPECKTNDREVGIKHWINFQSAIKAWRKAKFNSIISDEGELDKFLIATQSDPEILFDRDGYIIIHVSDFPHGLARNVYRCRMRFVFKYAFGFLSDVPNENRITPIKSVAAYWNGSMEIKNGNELRELGITLIDAGYISDVLSDTIKDPIERAASQFIKSIPKDWPCFISVGFGKQKLDDIKLKRQKVIQKHNPRLAAFLKRLSEKPSEKLTLKDRELMRKFPAYHITNPVPLTPPPTN